MATEIKATVSRDTLLPVPAFKSIVVADKLRDGYWVEAVDVDNNGKIDLVASGLAEGHVVWYENPGRYEANTKWTMHPVKTFFKPVALVSAKLTNDSYPDLIACHNYGGCMFDCKPGDGTISWLKNPGPDKPGNTALETWELRHVADLLATHRIILGHFTQKEKLELLALPVVGPDGVHKPVEVTLYTIPDAQDITNRENWSGVVIDKTSFRVIHGVVKGKFGASGLDSVLLACEEGIVHLSYMNNHWQKESIGSGEPPNLKVTSEIRQFKGSGNVAAGKMGTNPLAYIATLEPFHGSTVAVYTKSKQAASGWKRTILDIFGDQDKQTGEGNGHHVVTADFDGDGNDEFLVALRGPNPWQGVFYYKVVDLENGVFTKTRVSDSSAARIAVADFDGDGRLDFATTGYYTPGYFLADNPQIRVFLNDFAPKIHI
jgi:hypothetical protein